MHYAMQLCNEGKRWRIIYKIENDTVFIVVIVDSSRNIENILFQKLLRDDNKTLDDE